MPTRRGRQNGANLVSILNSNASTDESARQLVLRVFVPLLGITFFLDLICSFAMIWIKCHEDINHGDGGGVFMICVKKEMRDGLLFPLLYHKKDNDFDAVGDLVWLALIRFVLTMSLLWGGLRIAKRQKNERTERPNISSANTESTESNGDSLTTPLLPNGNDDGDNNTSDDENLVTNASSSILPQEVEEEIRGSNNNRTNINVMRESCCSQKMAPLCCKPSFLAFFNSKTFTQVLLFISSTFYQIYAGVKVSTYPHHHDNPALPILMSLSIVWINAISYYFHVILGELSREDGLFLPAEVHTHPVFYKENRSLAVHWCDLCQQRIKLIGDDTMLRCYRCALCDFDICIPCAQRSDAATVGENILRGDSGVRVEAALDNKSYFRRSLELVRPELPLLMLSFTFLACSSMTQLLLPHFQGHIVDKVVPDPNTGRYDKEGFLSYIKLYAIFMLVQGAVSTLYSAMFTLVSRRLKFTVRNTLFERILSQDVAYFDGTESGRLISRLTNDLNLMMAPIQSSLSSLLNNLLILVGGMMMCFIKSYRLSMLAFVTVGPITYLWDLYAKWSKGLAREMLSHWAEGNSIASQALSHVRTVKAFGCEERVVGKYEVANKQALNCGIKDAWGNGITSALTGYLDLGSGILILYYGGLLVYEGEMTVGELVTFQLFWNMMNNAYQNLQNLITSFTRSAAGAEKIFSLWDSEPDINPKIGSDISPVDVKGNLELKNVKFFYQMRPDNIVLDNFNLTIPSGKTTALVGRSGGGKSTIINLLLRFYDAKEGCLLLDGEKYPSFKVEQLRRLFGVVAQETELFALTVEENIAYGLNKDEYSMDDIIAAAKKAQAYEFITEMKDGFQTRIGERGNRLSGGQRQRIAIARVFLRKPKIILLDEATSALDENSQAAVQLALSTLIKESNATVVLVAHRLTTVMNAHSIVVIDKGSVLEQGTHSELVAEGGIYASMVEKQSKKMADELDQDVSSNADKKKKPGKKAAIDDIDSLLDDQTTKK